MKKLLMLLLAALLLLGSASALDSNGYPAFDGALPANALGGTFDAERLLLQFDASADFSMCANGYLQACFYTMNDVENSYIEIYLILPQSIAAGDVITPDSACASGMNECGVSFYEVLETREIFYFAMQNDAGRYPQTSDYEIRIASFAETDAAYIVHGTLTAVLAEMEELQTTGRVLTLRDAEFDFTLPKSAAPQPATPEPTQAPFDFSAPDSSQPPFDFSAPDSPQSPFGFVLPDPSDGQFFFALPAPTHAPSDAAVFPAFTLPPHYAKI